jgi:predicted phage gp36 major capsid-like protein
MSLHEDLLDHNILEALFASFLYLGRYHQAYVIKRHRQSILYLRPHAFGSGVEHGGVKILL